MCKTVAEYMCVSVLVWVQMVCALLVLNTCMYLWKWTHVSLPVGP